MKSAPFIAFILFAIGNLFCSLFFSSLHLIIYAPFFALLYLRASFIPSLFLSLFTGIFADLFSASFFGFHTLSCLILTFFIHSQKRFFNEKTFGFLFFTFWISLFSTLIELPLLFLFDKEQVGKWCLGDLLSIPFATVLFAFFWFTLPLKLLEGIKMVFFLKKRRSS